jgi:hypothetical protein
VVAILCNSAHVSHGFLRSLAAQTHSNYPLFDVDNASKDSTLEMRRGSTGSRSRVIAYPDDLGVAAGNNPICRALKAGVKLVDPHDAKLLRNVGYLAGGEDSAFSTFHGTGNRIFSLLKYFGVLAALPWLVVRQAIWVSKLTMGKRDKAWYKRKNDAFGKAFQMDRSPRPRSMP